MRLLLWDTLPPFPLSGFEVARSRLLSPDALLFQPDDFENRITERNYKE